MAKIRMNAVTRHLQGKIGDVVFSRRDGKPVAQLRPDRTNVEPTARQLETRVRFKKATIFANAVMQDPIRREVYQRVATAKQQPLYSVIIGDYFKPPVIQEIGLANYAGKAGGRVQILATDDVVVVGVSVLLRDRSDQSVIEQGAAALIDGYWVYTATTNLAPAQLATFEVEAEDLAGNKTKQLGDYL